MSPRIAESWSMFPKVVVTEKLDGRLVGSCGGCETAAVIVGKEAAQGFVRRHQRCKDRVERV